jgi:hypothetical protein
MRTIFFTLCFVLLPCVAWAQGWQYSGVAVRNGDTFDPSASILTNRGLLKIACKADALEVYFAPTFAITPNFNPSVAYRISNGRPNTNLH